MSTTHPPDTIAGDLHTCEPGELIDHLRAERRRAWDTLRHRDRYADPEGERVAALAEVARLRAELDRRGIDPLGGVAA